MGNFGNPQQPTRGIQFAPVVQTKRGLKKPDFLWETTLGSPYVECKQASSSENGMTKRLNRLFGVATKEYGLRPIDDDSVRLDLAVGQISNGVEQRVRQVVRQLCAVWQLDEPIQLGEITGVVRPRVALLPGTSEVLRTFQMTLSTAPTKIDIENAQLSLELGMGDFRAQLALRLVREARQQLPDNGLGAVFVDVSSMASAIIRLQKVMASSHYVRTPWICFSVGGVPAQAVWINGQPLDDRLFDGRAES